MNVPGRAGYSLLGDESLEFWKGPRAYMEKRCVLYGHVFLGRILNKPTVFLTSSRAVKEALNDKSENFSMGYREFMFELFEENLIFLEGDAWQVPRDMLYQVFNNDNLSQSMDICKQLIYNHTKEIPLGNTGDRDLVWTFGGGPRTCIGKHLTNVILKEWLKHLLTSLTWELPPGQDISYKMLPVIRPTDNVQIIFNRLDPEPQAHVQTIDDRTTSTHTNSDQ